MNRSRRWYLIAGGLMVATILFIAIFAEQITKVSPYYIDAKPSAIEQGTPPFAPDDLHLLGTDRWGRDVWSRLAFGTRWSLLFAFLIMSARMLVAVPMAVAAAFGPRFVNWLTGRLYVYTSSIPPLLIYLLILSAPGLRTVGLIPSVAISVTLLTLVEWPRIAVVIRGRLEELSTEQFVEGAVAVGASPWRIFWTHLMPHLWPTLLNLVVAEMGRGLLIVAQLGIFGVLVGGGIIETAEDARGNPVRILTTGIPEWATLLSDARTALFQSPWLPISAASAFFLGIVGFNMLSQGLEGLTFSLERMKAATTGRLSARWRWAWLVIPVLGGLWYYQGAPWGREAGVRLLAMRQMEALNKGDIPAFLATIAPDSEDFKNEQEKWLSDLLKGDQQVVVVEPSSIQVKGDEATALWSVVLGYRDKPPVTATYSVKLVRRLGTWMSEGESFSKLRGIHTDLEAYYDPLDPTVEAADKRFEVTLTATTADHAFEKVDAIFKDIPGAERPKVKLYPSHEAFQVALAGQTGDKDITVWYTPGQSIRVSPAFLKGYNRRRIEQALAYEMIKFLTASRLNSTAALPVAMGMYELKVEGGERYRIDFDRYAGMPFYTVDGLFAVGLNDLPQAKLKTYTAQSAVLVELMSSKLSPEQLLQTVKGAEDPVAALAAAMGTDVAGLNKAYMEYLQKRVGETSVLNVPAGRARIPVLLTDMIAARAKAAVEGDEAAFLQYADESQQAEHAAWLKALREAGLKGYDVTVLDANMDAARPQVYVLETFTFADGHSVSGIAIQEWVQPTINEWKAGPVSSPFAVAGR